MNAYSLILGVLGLLVFLLRTFAPEPWDTELFQSGVVFLLLAIWLKD